MDEDKFLDVLETAIKAAKMEPEQLRAFRIALEKALGGNPLTTEDSKNAQCSLAGN